MKTKCVNCKKEITKYSIRCKSCSNKNRKGKYKWSIEAKQNIKNNVNYGMKGKHHTEETKKKIGTGFVVHHKDGNHENDIPENRRKMLNRKHVALHHKQGDMKNSGFKKGNISHTGKKFSKETREKMSKAQKRKIISEETKRKMSISAKRRKRNGK